MSTGASGTFDGSGWNPKVSADRSDPTRAAREAPKNRPITQAELADFYLADHNARQERDTKAEAEKAETIRQAKLREQAEADRKRKKAVALFNDNLIDGEFFDLTDAEKSEAWMVLIDSGQVDVEHAAVLAATIRANRTQNELRAKEAAAIAAMHPRIRAIKERTTPAGFALIEKMLAERSQPKLQYGWTKTQVADGTAHESCYRALGGEI